MTVGIELAFADFFARSGIQAEALASNETVELLGRLKAGLGVGISPIAGAWRERGERAERAYTSLATSPFVVCSPRPQVPAYRCEAAQVPPCADLRRFLWWLKGNWGQELSHGPLDLAILSPEAEWVLVITAENDLQPLFAHL